LNFKGKKRLGYILKCGVFNKGRVLQIFNIAPSPPKQKPFNTAVSYTKLLQQVKIVLSELHKQTRIMSGVDI
jgi:hypothetical protein